MYLISIASQKGGSGKSTLTAAVATTLAVTLGRRVLVIDADPQQSLQNKRTFSDVHELREGEEFPYQILTMEAKVVVDHLDSLSEAEDGSAPEFVFVDLPGRSEDLSQVTLILSCDLVIVPLAAADFDQMSTASFITGIKNAMASDAESTLDLVAVRNKVNPGQIEEQGVDGFFESYEVPQLPIQIRDRASYKRVSTLRPFSDSRYTRENNIVAEARQEVLQLATAIVNRLEGSHGSASV